MQFRISLIFTGIYFCLAGLHGQKAAYVVHYDFNWVTDTTQMSYSVPEVYILYRVGSESRFLNSYQYNNDTIYYNHGAKMGSKKNTQESVSLFMATEATKIIRLSSEIRLLKDFQNNHFKNVLFNTSGRHYLKEPLPLNWTLLPGLDTIAGILSYKAQTQHGGRQYTAWYTPQIPINDGPYVFHGLPGLITKVVDHQNWYNFELKSYQIKPKGQFKSPPFITQDFKQEIDRKTYVKNTTKEKEAPKYRYYYKKVTPEIQMALNEKRKKRFDLIIEQNR